MTEDEPVLVGWNPATRTLDNTKPFKQREGNKSYKWEDEENPRIFTRQMKKECWERALTVKGRNPSRWRMDPVGNVVSAKLTSCEGCLCHEYDHIIPFSKGGLTNVENCQILQTGVNRFKGNKDNDMKELKGYSCHYSFADVELDAVELALYGDIKRDGRECRIPMIMEQWASYQKSKKSQRRQLLEKIPPCLPIAK